MTDLLDAVRAASPEQIVEAFSAAIHAAYANNPAHGYMAAHAVLVQSAATSARWDEAFGQSQDMLAEMAKEAVAEPEDEAESATDEGESA